MRKRHAVSNTSCLIAFEAIGRLDLLRKLYSSILLPPAVVTEWGMAIPVGMSVQAVQDHLFVQKLSRNLGPGEAEAIVLARETAARRIILDDNRARRMAERMKLPVTGCLGMLIRAKRLKHVATVKPLLDDLIAVGLYVGDDLYQDVLRRVGE